MTVITHLRIFIFSWPSFFFPGLILFLNFALLKGNPCAKHRWTKNHKRNSLIHKEKSMRETILERFGVTNGKDKTMRFASHKNTALRA
jgi:hypothetical protein